MSKGCVMVMAGGTGGHIFPALAVAQELMRQDYDVIWLGSEGAMETRLVPQYGIPLHTLAIKGVRKNGWRRKLSLPFTLMQSISRSLKIIRENRVKAVIGFGGFVSFPGGVAAKLARLPLLIHEQNAVMGLSNKLLSYLAYRVFYAFPGVFADQSGLVGNPVRQDLRSLPEPRDRFKNHTGPLRVLVMGGSLGAKIFNDRLPEAFATLPKDKQMAIIHQTGKGNQDAVKAAYLEKGVEADVREFIKDMAEVYDWADIVICRAGALTVAELAAVGLGAVLVPYPHAVDDHQTHNAQYLVQGQAAHCIAQPNVTIDYLSDFLMTLSRDSSLEWASNARALALPNAAAQVATATVSALNRS